MKPHDLTGHVYGFWTVVSFAGRVGSVKRVAWLCKCKCGVGGIVRADALRNGNSVSCGCKRVKHGLTGTRTWNSWRAARHRCNNPNAYNYDRYGGQGITFYKPWNDFLFFLCGVGKAPTETHTLDRIDPYGNYEPGNVRWATALEQAHNKREPYDQSANDWEEYESNHGISEIRL